MAAVKKKEQTGVINILPPSEETITLYVLGRTAFICNAMSEKAQHELLSPHGRLSTWENRRA